MKYAVVARPPVVGGKVVVGRLDRGDEGAGRREGRADRRHARAGEVRAARRRRGGGEEHLGGDQGPRGAEDHLGRRAEQAATTRPPTRRCSRRTSRKPGKVERNDGDADAALKSAAKVITARVLRAAPAARHDGAAGRDRADDQRQVGGVGAAAKPRRRARRHRQGARHQAGGDGRCTTRCSAAASGASRSATSRSRRRCLEGDGRRAGEGGVDARGRHPPRLLSHRVGGPSRGGPRRQQQGGGVAASQRGADLHVDLRARPEASRRHRARHGLGRHAVRRAEHPHGERRGARAVAHRLVPLGQQRDARLVRAVVHRRDRRADRQGPEGLPARADRAGAHRRSAQAGQHDRVVELRRAVGRLRRSTPDGCARSPSLRPSGPAGARQLPKGRGLGIAAHRSFVQLHRDRGRGGGRRQGQHHRAARRHRGRLRLLRQSRSACARRSKARP